MLEQASRNEEPQMPIDDEDPGIEVKPLKARHDLLSMEVEVKPAASLAQLDEQVFHAKQIGCDSVEATKALVKAMNRVGYEAVEKMGFFLYHDIKVFISGSYEDSKKKSSLTMEQALFGNSKIAVTPIMNEDKNK